jgi:hypothetical protein
MVVCINDMYSTLTLYRTYRATHTLGSYYYLEGDNNENFYPRYLFMPLEDYRNKILEKIL